MGETLDYLESMVEAGEMDPEEAGFQSHPRIYHPPRCKKCRMDICSISGVPQHNKSVCKWMSKTIDLLIEFEDKELHPRDFEKFFKWCCKFVTAVYQYDEWARKVDNKTKAARKKCL